MVWLGLVWFGKIFVTSCASWVIWKSPIWLCLADLTPWLHGTNLLWLLASLLYPQRYGVNLWLSSTKPGLTWERGFLSLIFGDYESVLNAKSPLKHSDLASCKWLLSPFWMPNLSYSNNQGDQHTDIHKAYDTWYHKTMLGTREISFPSWTNVYPCRELIVLSYSAKRKTVFLISVVTYD